MDISGRPGFLNTAGDIHLLPAGADAASRYQQRPSDEEMQELVKRASLTTLFVG